MKVLQFTLFLPALLLAQVIPLPKPGVVDIDPDHFSQHDLIYLSPPVFGREGLPIGDGESGVILWNPSDHLMMQINHSALWDDMPAEPDNPKGFTSPRTDSEKEGELSINRHAARVKIETGLPLFDWKYLRNYEARLNLYNAEIEIRGEGSMGSASVNALYSHPHNTLMVEYRDRTRALAPRRILLSRLGSRAIPRWTSVLQQDTEIGLGGTNSGAAGREFWVSKKLGSLDFAVAVLLDGDDFRVAAVNGFECQAESGPVSETSFRLYLAVAHSDETSDPLRLARERVRKAAADGAEKVRQMHRADWALQWSRGFIDLPEDRYLENLWTLIDYMNISSRRGMHPPFFLNSIWSWNHDIQAWAGSKYHWNMWSPNSPLFATGRVELLRPYFDWKRRQFPHAIRYAKDHFGIEGAAFTDYASRRGEQPRGGHRYEKFVVVGPQVAQEFYKYWQYTQDDEFLKREALPFLRETAQFYMNYLVEGEDGKLHIRETLPYEFAGPYHFRDCITDQAMLRWLLPALKHAEEITNSVSELSRRADMVLERLAPIQSGPIDEDWLIEKEGRKVYANPFFRGEPYSPEDRVYSTGFSTKHNRYVTHMEVNKDLASMFGVLCGAQVCPVWPAGLVGPDQSPQRRSLTGKDSPQDVAMWERGRNGLRTMRKFPVETIEKFRVKHADTHLSWTGHNNDLPAFLRLALTRQLRVALETYVEKYQILPQGFWNYWPWERWKDGVSHPKGSKSGQQIPFPEDPRMLHSSLEPTGIFAVTINEMLMTSYDGVIRLFPAYDRDAGFRLAAVGGFWVTARQTDGEVQFVQIESYAGKECVISTPWTDRRVTVRNLRTGEALRFRQERDRIRFATRRGELYILRPEASEAERWHVTGKRRTQPHSREVRVHTLPYFKDAGTAQTKVKWLGKPRDF